MQQTVIGQSQIADRGRRENSAEHSWYLAVFALILADDGLDAGKVITMLLIHDIEKIDAGYALIHGVHDTAALELAEQQAAARLIGLLPVNHATRLPSL